MKVLSATEVKNRLGEALAFPEDESLLIEKNGKEAFMAFTAPMGKKMVLASYAQGGVSRSTAMKLLGLEWYGQLLDALAETGIERPSAPEAERRTMVRHAKRTLGRR